MTIVLKRLNPEDLADFTAYKGNGDGLVKILLENQKSVADAKKQEAVYNSEVANIQKEIKNVVGPILTRATQCIEWELGMSSEK